MPHAHDPETPHPAHLLHLTDPHLFADPAAEIYGIRTTDSFRAVVEQALQRAPVAPDAILVTGDIGDDLSEAAYRRFRTVLESTGIPAFCLPGNHDDPASMRTLLAGGRLQYGGQATLRAWRIVLLESHVPDAPHGELGADRLAALQQTLDAVAGQPVLVAVHHPPMPVGSPWIDGLGLRDGAALLELLRRHPDVRAVLSGHVHQAFDEARGGLRLLTSPSTCAQFTPRTEDCVMDTRPPGWRWLQLHADGRIDTRVHWLDGWQPRGPLVDSRAHERDQD